MLVTFLGEFLEYLFAVCHDKDKSYAKITYRIAIRNLQIDNWIMLTSEEAWAERRMVILGTKDAEERA